MYHFFCNPKMKKEEYMINTPKVFNYMEKALEMANVAFLKGEVPVGAVLVDSETNTLIAQASNEMRLGKDPLLHAEMIVIREGLLKQGVERFWNKLDLYVTLEPCPMCAQAISFVRIRRLYFGAYDPKGGGVDHGPHIFDSSSCHHKPEIYGGIEEKASIKLLKDFFEEKRK